MALFKKVWDQKNKTQKSGSQIPNDRWNFEERKKLEKIQPQVQLSFKWEVSG